MEIDRQNNYAKIGDLYVYHVWKISEVLARLEDFSQLDQKQHACYMFLFKEFPLVGCLFGSVVSWKFLFAVPVANLPRKTPRVLTLKVRTFADRSKVC